MPTIILPNCPFNIGVNCGERKCRKCGWNPVVAKERKEELRYNMPESIKFRESRERWLIGRGEFPRKK